MAFPNILKSQIMASLFTKIVNGEIPSYKIAETDKFYAFLDINPNTKGHSLCIPKQEIDKVFDLDEKTYTGLMAFSRKVALAMRKTLDCKRIGMAVVGLEVPHVHVHLIPLNTMKDIDFKQKAEVSKEEFEQTAWAICEKFEQES